jgi:hypothetical protein
MAVRTNYAYNPSFRTDTDSNGTADNVINGGDGATITWTIVAGRLGNYAQRMQATRSAGSSIGLAWGLTDVGTFVNGDTVTFSAYLKGSCSVALALTIWVRTSAGASTQVISGSDIHSSLTSSFQQFSVTGTINKSNASRCYFGWFGGSWPAGASLDVTTDSMLAEKAASVGGYFDGSTSQAGYTYAWLGTTDASASTETASAAIWLPTNAFDGGLNYDMTGGI